MRTLTFALLCRTQGVAGIAAQLVLALVLWYGGKLVLESRMSAGTLISFLFYTFQVAMSFALLSTTYGDFMQAVGASSRVFQILDRKPAIRFRGGETPAVCRGEISLQNVRFSYPSRPDAAVLHGLHVRIMPGRVLAIVGMSGGGKSTIISLLERFYEASAGTVTIGTSPARMPDGSHALAQTASMCAASTPSGCMRKLRWWYACARVPARGLWFAHEVRLVVARARAVRRVHPGEHWCVLRACACVRRAGARAPRGADLQCAAFGRESASMDDIERVAKEANAYDFISSFPEKFETAVGERGVRLSGGQKQRIAIARALLMDPKVGSAASGARARALV